MKSLDSFQTMDVGLIDPITSVLFPRIRRSTHGEVEIPPGFLSSFLTNTQILFSFYSFSSNFLISAIFLEYFCSTLLFIFTSIISFHFFPEPCNFFFKRNSQSLSAIWLSLAWADWLVFVLYLCYVIVSGMPVHLLSPLFRVFSGRTFSLWELFWKNSSSLYERIFSFYVDCAVLVNHCCSFLKGWYGREASKVSWVSYHLRLLFTPWSCLSLSREVTQPSMIIDGGLIAFQMWSQMPTSLCSSQ